MSETKPRRQRRSDYKAFVPITSRWSDNDMFGHLNNAAYYSYFDTAVTSWLFGSRLPADGSRLFFVAETGCRYLADARQTKYVRDGWNITGDAFVSDENGRLS